MKFQCDRKTFLGAVKTASAAAAKRSVNPVLQNVKISAIDDTLLVQGSDGEVGVGIRIDGKVSAGGSTVINPARVVSVLRECDDEEIAISSDGDGAVLKTSSGRFTLLTLSPDEFPLSPDSADGTEFTIPAAELKNLVSMTLFAASKNEGARWSTHGILWIRDEKSLTLVGTDTKRLSIASFAHESSASKVLPIVPTKTMELLLRNLDEGDVTVILQTNAVFFSVGNCSIHSKVLEGKFPPHEKILPKKLSHHFKFSVPELLSKVRQAAAMSDDESKRVDLYFSDGSVVLSAKGPNTGSGEVEMPVDFAGDKMAIAFDPQYLIDILVRADSSEIVFSMTNSSTPAVFRIGDHITYLVMPLCG